MTAAKIPLVDFVREFERPGGGAAHLARLYNVTEKNVYARRRRIEKELGRELVSPGGKNLNPINDRTVPPGRLEAQVYDGTALIMSDMHYWPGIVSTAHRAFVKFCHDLQPNLVILNGDVFDGAGISRHPPIGWEKQPTLIEEIEACTERLEEIEKAAPNARRIWNLGNHDARFETRLATVAPEYAKVHGVHLRDHFPYWEPAWSTWINDSVVVKHRIKNGIHAPHNNVLWAGKTVVTGHLHSQKVYPLSDYNGTRWGFDTGTGAEPYGPQFNNYTEDNPVNWRSGFGALTFVKGELLDPEYVRVVRPGTVWWRGSLIDV